MDKVSTTVVTSDGVRCLSRYCLLLSFFCSILLLVTAIGSGQELTIGTDTVATRFITDSIISERSQTPHDSDNVVDIDDPDTLRIRLVRSLGLTRMPDISLSQSTIPKEVMDQAYETYRENKRKTEDRHQQLISEDGDHQDEPFVVTYNSQGVAPPRNLKLPEWLAISSGNCSASWFNFPTYLHNQSAANEGDNDVDIIQASLQSVGRVRIRKQTAWWWWQSSIDGVGQWEPLSRGAGASINSLRTWDVSDAVRTWVQNPTSLDISRGFILVNSDCDASHINSSPVTLRLSVSMRRRRPLSNDILHRSKRSTPHDLLKEPAWTGKTDCRKGTRHNYCCRKSLTVTAEQLGLGDIIIEPKKFNFYHCRGKCPHKYNPASTHAILQSLIYRTYKKGGKVCCSPSKLGDLEVLHLDEAGKNPVHSQWKNAVVLECACS